MKELFLLVGCCLLVVGCPASSSVDIQEAIQARLGNEWSIMEFDLVRPSADGRLIQFAVKVVNVKTGADDFTYGYWNREKERLVFTLYSGRKFFPEGNFTQSDYYTELRDASKGIR